MNKVVQFRFYDPTEKRMKIRHYNLFVKQEVEEMHRLLVWGWHNDIEMRTLSIYSPLTKSTENVASVSA